MQPTFINKTSFETDVITKFLDEENISYTTKVVGKFGILDLYDISVYTDYEHYLFIKKLSDEKLEPYLKAMRSYILPCYAPKINNGIEINITMPKNTPILVLDKIHKRLEGKYADVTVNIDEDKDKPCKKSMLLRLLERIKGNNV